MVKFLVDTNVVIDQLRGIPKAHSFLLANKHFISHTTIAELIHGTKNKDDLKTVSRIVSTLEVIPIRDMHSETAISLMDEFFLSHHLEFMDALIAATAIEEDLTLVTSNTKHFSFIKGLKLEDWEKVKVSGV